MLNLLVFVNVRRERNRDTRSKKDRETNKRGGGREMTFPAEF